jgi:hypothetical protein
VGRTTRLLSALFRLRSDYPALAQQWQRNPLYKAALGSDLKTAAGYGGKGLLELVATSHSGMTSDQFEQTVSG